mmetsp:Transcript_14397/g.35193  ORF Transcript_14397/g.35193 Transcript_14397/m.35193 type:complete len:99 (-) Transcript_14397:286-582(-)
MFAEVQQYVSLREEMTMLSLSDGGGLTMGTSSVKKCSKKYLRKEGGKKMCADGNATDNWDTPPKGGWGFYDNGFADPVPCTSDAFCPRPKKGDKTGYF